MDRERRSLVIIGTIMLVGSLVILGIAMARGKDLGGPTGLLVGALLIMTLGAFRMRRRWGKREGKPERRGRGSS